MCIKLFDPLFIEERRNQNLSSQRKGNEAIIEEEEIADEERFMENLQIVVMISTFEMTLPKEKSSKKTEEEEEVNEKHMVDYEPSPTYTPIVVLSLEEAEEGDDEVVSCLVLRLKAMGGN